MESSCLGGLAEPPSDDHERAPLILNPASGKLLLLPGSALGPPEQAQARGTMSRTALAGCWTYPESCSGLTPPRTLKTLPLLSSQPSLPRARQEFSVQSLEPTMNMETFSASANDQYGLESIGSTM